MAPFLVDQSNGRSIAKGENSFLKFVGEIQYPSVDKSQTKNSDLDASAMTVTLTSTPRDIPSMNSKEVQEGRAFTDHMITVSWTEEHGWANPQLVPYGPLSFSPSASVLQYATECFEGMKVFRGYDGQLRLFRPMHNCRRMLASAQRISLPAFAPEELLKLIQKLCAIECPKWLPVEGTGSFLYLRPTMIGTDQSLGPNIPRSATLVIFLAYWPLGRSTQTSIVADGHTHQTKASLRLLASRTDEVRAWPGGTGWAKIGANYGPAILAYGAAKKLGYDQILWLLGEDCQVTEAGSTNFFVIWRHQKSKHLQLITAPLTEGLVLAGVTRASILDLARERLVAGSQWRPANGAWYQPEPLEIVERNFTMFDILAAATEDRLMAAFAVGTAFFVNPVSQIRFRDCEVNIKVDSLPHVELFKRWLTNIMYGQEPSSWVIQVGDV